MQNSNNQVIETYLQRISELREQQPLQQSDLEALALELGLTAADIAAAQQQAADGLIRGQGYLKYQRWQDAISELTQAAALDPLKLAIWQQLAAAYQGQFQQTRKRQDYVRAVAIAKQCLALQPADEFALALLNRLDEPLPSKRRLLWGLGAGAVIMFGGGLIYGGLPIFGPEFLVNQGSGQPSPSVPPLNPSLTTVPPTDGPQPEQDIPVAFTALGLTLQPRLSRLSNYKESSFYKLQGVLVNNSDQELVHLRLRVDYLNAEGQVIATDSKTALADSDALLRPRDTHAFSLIQELSPQLAQVRLTVTTRDQLPAAAEYAPSPPVDYTWGFEQPANMRVAIAARSDQFTPYASGSAYHDAIFAITNTGDVAIQRLKLQIDFYNAQNAPISSEDLLIVYGDDAPLLPQETRPKRSIHEVPKDYTRYQLTILEAE